VPEIVSAPKLDVPVTTGGRGTTSLKLALDCTALTQLSQLRTKSE
jgi:hypothetical protein